MKRPGHLIVKLKSGIPLSRAPAHLDVLAGACRPLGTIDGGGRVDRSILNRVDAMRVRRAFHARQSLGHMGQQATRYDDLEHELGLSEVMAVELSDPARSDSVVEALSALDAVDYAMVEPLAFAPLDAAGVSEVLPVTREAIWHPRDRINLTEALQMEPGGARVTVAVIDTGISLQHPEFVGQLRAGFDTVDLGIGLVASGVRLFGDSRGRDFCARDYTGHGTHVAGILGARGERLPPGAGGRARVRPIRSLAAATVGENGGDGEVKVIGVGGTLDINTGIKVASDTGCDVLNMSFGTPADLIESDAPPHAEVIRYALAKGIIPIAAIGNSGREEDYFPAALPGVIAVGSMGDDGHRSDFSTWGRHIALCAPGDRIISAGLRGYRESTGTSHAAPFVSGVAALLVARAARRGVRLDSDGARRALTESAQPAAPGASEMEVGPGLLDAAGALRRLDAHLSER